MSTTTQTPQARVEAKTADLYRMVMPEHVCPYGLKARSLLRRHGYAVEDHALTTREDTDAFKTTHSVKTTPQTFINGQRIGGYDDLRTWFGGRVRAAGATTYTPVIALFGTALLVALALSFGSTGSLLTVRAVEWFIGLSMVLLALQKLKDVESFSTMFLNYDLLARRFPEYGYVYPFLELGAGVLMLSGALVWLSAPVALLIGGIGAGSVFKAVYIDRRELKCACMGGDSSVPLGFVSLTENLMMVVMAVWMLARHGL